MNWVDQLQMASWRGVPFKTDSLEFVVGGSTVVRDYPFQDLPTTQDMGTATDEIRIAGYVIGDDYITQRDALIKVLRGSGVLVHPTRGRIRCTVKGGVKVRENPTQEGGIARFELVFIRGESRRYPSALPSTKSQNIEAIEQAKAAVVNDFSANFNTKSQPIWARQSTLDSTKVLLNDIERAIEPVVQNVALFKRKVRQIRNGTLSILSTPLKMAELISDIMTIDGVVTDALDDAIAHLQALWTPRLNDIQSPFNTPSRVRQRQNIDALDKLIKRLATLEVARLSALKEYQSFDDAISLRQQLSHQFNQLITDNNQRMVYDEEGGVVRSSVSLNLINAKTIMLQDLAARGRNLGRLVEYTPSVTQPLIYISYTLYGTAKYADEIKRNNPHVTHPMLVSAGKTLKVVGR